MFWLRRLSHNCWWLCASHFTEYWANVGSHGLNWLAQTSERRPPDCSHQALEWAATSLGQIGPRKDGDVCP
jgi:hypothetical protein